MKILLTCLALVCVMPVFAQQDSGQMFCGHPVMLDGQGKLLPRKVPAANAYDHFLRLRWNFVQTKAPMSPGPAPRSNYPQYYFYCAFVDSANVLLPDMWMNDVGEKNALFISAINKENLEEFRERVYEAVREIHITRFPYNKFLYPDYKDAVEKDE